jgi:hypothetical protein
MKLLWQKAPPENLYFNFVEASSSLSSFFRSLGTKTDTNSAIIKRARRVGHVFKYIMPMLYFNIFKTGLFDQIQKICLRQTTGNSPGP